MPRIITVGLDGATWDLLKPWADKGELPALRKLMENGVWGTLESTIPPLTCPAWPSMLTGKNPGKHGVFGFGRLMNDEFRLYSSNDIGSSTVYEILSMSDTKSIVIGLPLSFPPREGFNGIMVSDFLYHSKEIHPASKREYIENYRVLPDLRLKGEELLKDMVGTAKSQVGVAKRLFVEENWDFFLFYYGLTDTVGHHFWRDVADNTKIGQQAKEIFRIADEFLKWVVGQMDAEDILLIVSDHGFAPCPYEVNLNRLFMEKGLLRTQIQNISMNEYLGEDHVLFFERVFGKRRTIGLPEWLVRLGSYQGVKSISARVFKTVFRNAKVARSEKKVIDFSNSAAFVHPTERMSMHVREMGGKKRKEIVKEVKEMLEGLEHDGRKVFSQVLDREEVYTGSFTKFAPDILLVHNGFLVQSILNNALYGRIDTGDHDLKGIFLAYGSGIRASGNQLTDSRIYDIAPTILHILGLPIPRDMDGRVLKEIFEEGSVQAGREIAYQEIAPGDEQRRIRARIRGFKGSQQDSIK